MSDLVRVQVLLPKQEAERFATYCHYKGYKKSPLIARLVRDHLNKENFHPIPGLFDQGHRERDEL